MAGNRIKGITLEFNQAPSQGYDESKALMWTNDTYDDLLVAPIAAGTGDERDVYLPTADKWEDYFTGEPVGNGKIHVKTGGIPVYRRVKR